MVQQLDLQLGRINLPKVSLSLRVGDFIVVVPAW
jgi:hypothetical protein